MKSQVMVKGSVAFLLLFSISLFISSCKDEDEPEEIIVTDVDGNSYKTVTIGDMVWMAEDLRVTHFRNGDPIERLTGNQSYQVVSSPKYYFIYDDVQLNSDLFGNLYTWYVVNDTRGIAPDGWHVPSHAEWNALQKHLGMSDADIALVCDDKNSIGGKMKSTSSIYWSSPNTGATDEVGLSLYGSGFRSHIKDFKHLKAVGAYWSSTQKDNEEAWYRHLYSDQASLCSRSGVKKYGFSIRCVRD